MRSSDAASLSSRSLEPLVLARELAENGFDRPSRQGHIWLAVLRSIAAQVTCDGAPFTGAGYVTVHHFMVRDISCCAIDTPGSRFCESLPRRSLEPLVLARELAGEANPSTIGAAVRGILHVAESAWTRAHSVKQAGTENVRSQKVPY